MALVTTRQGAALSVRHLGWQQGDKRILRDISFDVEPGQVIGILGPNGVGKSTLLRCLYRYLTPTSGQVHLNGQAIGQLSSRQFAKEVAVVLQHAPSGFPVAVRQLLSSGLIARRSWWQWGESAQECADINTILVRLGLTQHADSLFETLSGGEKQRVLIARALVQQPGLLLLDEPTNHLDVRYQIEVMQLIRSLGITVVTSIHDLNLAGAFCDKLLLMKQGRVAAFGTPDEVLRPCQLAGAYGVNSHIDRHPSGGFPRVTIDFQVPFDATA